MEDILQMLVRYRLLDAYQLVDYLGVKPDVATKALEELEHQGFALRIPNSRSYRPTLRGSIEVGVRWAWTTPRGGEK